MSPNDQAQIMARFDKVDASVAALAARLTAIEGKPSQPEPVETEPINFATGAALEEVRRLASDTQLLAMRLLNGEGRTT